MIKKADAQVYPWCFSILGAAFNKSAPTTELQEQCGIGKFMLLQAKFSKSKLKLKQKQKKQKQCTTSYCT